MRKKFLLLLLTANIPFFVTACPSPSTTSPMAESSARPYDYNNSYPAPSGSAYPQAAASAAPSLSATDLSSLRAGVLPENAFTDEEKKLAGFLVRKTTPVFPLKIGVLLYKNSDALPESDRRKYVDSFINSLQGNPNIGQVLELSPDLVSKRPDIDEIRRFGARFQVSSVLVVNESYPFPTENPEAVLTPIDSITGSRTWQSFSNIEVYAVDVLNGVFLFSTSSGIKENQKYNKTSSNVKNPDLLLVRSTAEKAWKGLEDKVNKEVNDYKYRLDNNKIIPITVQTPIPLP